jgi:hypothetical protein
MRIAAFNPCLLHIYNLDQFILHPHARCMEP